MVVAWIVRDEAGLVVAFSAVAHTDPATLDEMREGGRNPELVEASGVQLNAPLPTDARVLVA